MRNRLAPDTEQRRIAKRCWLGGMPRKEIAQLLDLPEQTIRRWRYENEWEPRKRYMDRPRKGKRKNGLRDDPLPTVWRCVQCQGRCDSPDGHPRCRPEAA